MTEQITLEEALELVTFFQKLDGTWAVAIVEGYCDTVKGNCGTVKGNCGIVKGNCGTVEGGCITVKGNCIIVKGNCDTVEGDCNFVKGDCNFVKGNCGTVEGKVLNTINGRRWQYVETPNERFQRLLKKKGDQELIEAFNQLVDN